MNTELSPETIRTCSKRHGKIANNNSFSHQQKTSGCNVQSYQTTCYGNLSWKLKEWHDTTKFIEQKSFTDHEPKGHRKYNGPHVNMANDMTDSYMAGTTISRHVYELVPVTTEQYMTLQGDQQ